MSGQTCYFGLYRGTVQNNVDPMRLGRIIALVPDVTGLISTAWAMPCVPVAGPGSGMFVVPPVGASVWIQYEGGSPDRPVWVGGFWSSAATPDPPWPRNWGHGAGSAADATDASTRPDREESKRILLLPRSDYVPSMRGGGEVIPPSHFTGRKRIAVKNARGWQILFFH